MFTRDRKKTNALRERQSPTRKPKICNNKPLQTGKLYPWLGKSQDNPQQTLTLDYWSGQKKKNRSEPRKTINEGTFPLCYRITGAPYWCGKLTTGPVKIWRGSHASATSSDASEEDGRAPVKLSRSEENLIRLVCKNNHDLRIRLHSFLM